MVRAHGRVHERSRHRYYSSLDVYGVVAARDYVDNKRNILFHPSSHRYQTLTKSDPYLHLTGPCRAIVSVDPVEIEIQLNLKGQSGDRALINQDFRYRNASNVGYFYSYPSNHLCEMELCFEQLERTCQATVMCVRATEGSPFKYGGQVVCGTLPREDPCRKVVLFDSKHGRDTMPMESDGRMCMESDGYLDLSRRVVSVQGMLIVFVHTYSRSGAAARQLHAQLLLRGLPLPARAAVTLIASSFSSPRYARAIFDRVPAASANVYLWTATISSYAKHASPALAAEAFALFRPMLRSGPLPNAFTASSVLKSLSTLRAAHEVCQAHGFLVKVGLGSSVDVGAGLLDSYGSLGRVGDARRVFDEIPARNGVVGNAMVACYARGGDVEAAREVFDGMVERDSISWNTLMSGYLRQGDDDVARGLFDEMPQRNVNSWNMMITACSEARLWTDSVRVFNQMRLAGFPPDAATMAMLMSACAQLGFLSVAKQVHGLLHKGYVQMNCHVQNSLVDMFAKCGCICEAHFLFVETHPKDVVYYNVMMSALAQHGHGKDALKHFNEMIEEGLQPDAVTFLGVLSACAHAGLVDNGEHYFDSMGTTYAIHKSADHYACMVDLYGRAGLIEEAHHFVKIMSVKPHAGVWGALLNACRKHRNTDVGDIAARERMRIEPMNPGNYILHANTLARSQRWDAVEDARRLMRGNINGKNTGCSWVEVDTVVHEFLAGDFSHPCFDQIYDILDHLYLQLT